MPIAASLRLVCLTGIAALSILVDAARGYAQTWTIGAPFDSDMQLSHNHIIFGSESHGYAWGVPRSPAVPNPVLFRSIDSGKTWFRIAADYGGTGYPPFFWNAPDSNALCLLNEGSENGLGNFAQIQEWRTTNAGVSWDTNTPTKLTQIRYSAMFSRSEGVFDVDSAAATLMTYDSSHTLVDPRAGGDYGHWLGQGWAQFVGDWSDTSHWCYAIYQYIRDDSSSELPILYTTDGGHYWSAVIPDSSVTHHVTYKQVAFLRGTPIVYLVAQDTSIAYYRSTNYGATWKSFSEFASKPGHIAIRKIVPVTPTEAWALADSDNNAFGQQFLLHTTDAGTTWTVDSETFRGFRAADLFLLDAYHGWALLEKDSAVYFKGYPYPYHFDSIAYVARYVSADTTLSVSAAPNPPRMKLVLSPNPATHLLQVSGCSPGAVGLYDLLGREVIEARDDGSGAALDVSKLPAGMYLLRAGTEVARVIVAH